MQTNEQVVVIQGDATKWYSQVVFIMNPAACGAKIPVDFVAEAEKIVLDYMAKKRKHPGDAIHAYIDDYYTPPVILPPNAAMPHPKKSRRINLEFIFYGLMIAACIAITAVFAVGWLN